MANTWVFVVGIGKLLLFLKLIQNSSIINTEVHYVKNSTTLSSFGRSPGDDHRTNDIGKLTRKLGHYLRSIQACSLAWFYHYRSGIPHIPFCSWKRDEF